MRNTPSHHTLTAHAAMLRAQIKAGSPVGCPSCQPIRRGRLAATPPPLPDSETERMRRLCQKIKNGEKLTITPTGNVSDNPSAVGLPIPDGKLAAPLQQWYEKEPSLLEAEKESMRRFFPQFQLVKMDDGRLAWHGSLHIGNMAAKRWEIFAIYHSNHPIKRMGTSIAVILPEIYEIINALGWRPAHILPDEGDGLRLCTVDSDNVHAGENGTITSAAQSIGLAGKWLAAFELVLNGYITKDEFNRHDYL